MSSSTTEPARSEWRAIVARYQGASSPRAIRQVVSTLALLAASMTAAYFAYDVSVALAVAFLLLTTGLLLRTFVIMHDCAHGSFLPWRKVNDAVGITTGLLTMTPFAQWRREHALHHASSGDLDRRGYGDITTLTLREYLARSRWGRLRYRIYRHPAFLFGLGPLHVILGQRFVPRSESMRDRPLASVWWTNAGIVAIAIAAWAAFGPRLVLLVYAPAMYLAAAIGIFLFYVQHQFEDAYWEEHGNWDYATAAIEGSSYLKLPRVLQWFTGSIGLHHVHHLGPRIPNYRLQRAHDENGLFHTAPVVTLSNCLATIRLALWDEDRKRLIGFDEVREGATNADASAAKSATSDEGAPAARRDTRTADVDRAAA